VSRSVEGREQFAAAVNPDLAEDRLEVILHRVARDEEPLGDRTRVEATDERRDDQAGRGVGALSEDILGAEVGAGELELECARKVRAVITNRCARLLSP
jgi:hypothetical protein